jgi:hypothetical protein
MKNTELLWLIVSKSVTVGSQDNLVSLFNIIEQFDLSLDKKDIPEDKKIELEKADNIMFTGDFVLTALWRKTTDSLNKTSLNYTLKFTDQKGNDIISQEIKDVFPKDKKRKRMMHNISSLPVNKKGGTHYFKILNKRGEEIMKTPIEVTVKIK